MLRIERIFEEDGIRSELDAYNPLVPDGTQLEGDDDDRVPRRRGAPSACSRALKGIEDRVWVQVEGAERVYAIADEDLERENEEKTSAVHFLRFELAAPMAQALNGEPRSRSASITRSTAAEIPALPPEVRDALVADLREATRAARDGDRARRSRVRWREAAGVGEEVEQPGTPLDATVEPQVKFPSVPKDQDLLRFDVAPRTGLEFFVDPASISLGRGHGALHRGRSGQPGGERELRSLPLQDPRAQSMRVRTVTAPG